MKRKKNEFIRRKSKIKSSGTVEGDAICGFRSLIDYLESLKLDNPPTEFDIRELVLSKCAEFNDKKIITAYDGLLIVPNYGLDGGGVPTDIIVEILNQVTGITHIIDDECYGSFFTTDNDYITQFKKYIAIFPGTSVLSLGHAVAVNDGKYYYDIRNIPIHKLQCIIRASHKDGDDAE